MHASKFKTAFKQIAVACFAAGVTTTAFANPTGLSVASGSATVRQSGSDLTITASQNAFLNWQSFNIAAGQTTIFQQPSSTSIVWNRINDPNPSQIYGSLQANGVVVLMNSAGFYFGPNSFVSAAGLVVSTAQCAMPQTGGGTWEFNGPPPLAKIVNYGQMNIKDGGSAYLIADNIENYGTIFAPDGVIGLAAGQKVLLSERSDGRGISMQANLPSGSVDNEGHLIANGGTISVNAQVVNQNGIIQADSVQDQNGVIELVASDQLNLGADSQILARGDDSSGGSSGGTVTLQSGNNFSDDVGSQISATGGSQGGNGGSVEVSAPNILSLNSTMDASAQAGFTAGILFLDPLNIILDSSGTGSAGSGTVTTGSNPANGTLDLNVNSAFTGFSQIILQAKNNITLAQGTVFDLSDCTGVNEGQLTLEAGNNIIFGDQATISDENDWSVTLKAGVNNFTTGTVKSGVGSIYLNGGPGQQFSGAIQTYSGSINLLAGQDILLGAGHSSDSSVVTEGGGNIDVTAVAGSVNCGTDANGYRFGPSSYSVSGNLGGISTAAGGDVNITAGLDIISYLPTASNPAGDAGSGAFGPEPGNVTLTAGRDVVGHYVVADGTGTINAGANIPQYLQNGQIVLSNPNGDAGTTASDTGFTEGDAEPATSESLALSLINGGWTVNAAHDINLQEVRNPSGIFFNNQRSHPFDYAPGDYVDLNAGNGVQLLGSSLPRNSGQNIPSIYPSTLNITAGAGGVQIDNEVILYPSPSGSLEITTTDGGSLTGPSSTDPAQLIMSDSGQSQYTFNAPIAPFSEADHAAVPVHEDSPTPVELNIAGDMDNIDLVVPEAAQINVGGNMDNCGFVGQNLHSADVTSINVAGNILNRNEFTTVSVSSPPNFSLFNQAYPPSSFYANLANLFYYDPATGTLTFQGHMTQDILNALTSLQIQVYQDGQPEFDPQGNPVLTTVSILNTATAQALFSESQDVPFNPNTGYFIGGGGQFNFTAQNMDLGATLGIQSVGTENNPALAQYYNPSLPGYFASGADINVNLSGNLDMFSTTISSINGGNISVNTGGYVSAGSTFFTGNDQYARGIFTSGSGNVSVIAGGDINVNGSRIGAYDGGDVTVESLDGNIDAGTGGTGSVGVQEIYVDPITQKIYAYEPIIPGSGILATTFPPRDSQFPAPENTVGNILIEAPNGDINASAGGILQLPLNGADTSSAIVTVLAGYQLEDGHGNPVYADDLAAGNPVLISANRNIDASGSGVIGSIVNLQASGNVNGLVFARNTANVSAQQNVNVTVLAEGTANVSAGGDISGTIIGIGGVNASGSAIDASLLSENVSASGDTSGAKEGFAQGTAANSASQSMNNNQNTAVASDDDESKKKRGKGIALAQKVGRVTVELPPKNLSENQNSSSHL
jgi:filamentous hemagglutinin family protein